MEDNLQGYIFSSVLALVAFVLLYVGKVQTDTVTSITPLHMVQQPMLCTSPFDKYVAYEYELVDDNVTLITSHGRVYNVVDCDAFTN